MPIVSTRVGRTRRADGLVNDHRPSPCTWRILGHREVDSSCWCYESYLGVPLRKRRDAPEPGPSSRAVMELRLTSRLTSWD